MDPETSDGRVIFFLPWAGKTVAGTTDAPCEVTFSPAPQEKEVEFILNEIKRYLNPDVQGKHLRDDAWASLLQMYHLLQGCSNVFEVGGGGG